MHTLLHSLALIATAANAADLGCPYVNWTTISAIQSFNKNTSQYEIVDRDCNILPNTTAFQAIGDIENSMETRVEYKNMPWLVDIEHALWPRFMSSLTLQNVGVPSLKAIGGVTQDWANGRRQSAWKKGMEQLSLTNMAIDAMPVNLPKHTMYMSFANVSVSNMASFAAIRPYKLDLRVVPDLRLENLDYGSLAMLSISNTNVKAISNVQFKDATYLSFSNVTIDAIHDIEVRDLNRVWFTNARVSNWLMDAKTFYVFNSMPQSEWRPQSGGVGLSLGWNLKDSSFTYDKSLCDKQSGSVKTLWSQANLVVCVLPQPSFETGSNAVVVIGVSAASVIVLAGVLVIMYRKKVAALTSKYESTRSPTFTAKSIA
ncbi:Aste57867_12567 [Aphanomyces stellatus]|uniref:Aste57867_12567 protein n=1 Tax=Aphanomyces stellatus TaxID=120398 RepID=A0A485KWJ8_9STRA|nr:hypothetical protein As57867_012521 [Aphanomyces stellatus]VFT89418.1 Aste57867_12567 [Aphanomyces stellatus]